MVFLRNLLPIAFLMALVVLNAAVAEAGALKQEDYVRSILPDGSLRQDTPAPSAHVVQARSEQQENGAPSDPEAIFQKGIQYYNGQGHEQSYELARKCFEKAAEAGISRAASLLGLMHAFGQGGEKSYTQARLWLEKAAAMGEAEAQALLGKMYETGEGVQASLQIAREWYAKAAAQGLKMAQERLQAIDSALAAPSAAAKKDSDEPDSKDAHAQYLRGLKYFSGQGLKQSYELARDWFEKAVRQGHAGAQLALGSMYASGHGIAKSAETARKWLEKAAAQGRARAAYLLGIMHREGDGAPQSYKLAKEWFEKAATQGLADAQLALGTLYLQGHGVAKSYDRARAWFEKAASQGSELAREAVRLIQQEGQANAGQSNGSSGKSGQDATLSGENMSNQE